MLRRFGILFVILTVLAPSVLAHRDFVERPTSVSQEPSRTTVSFSSSFSGTRVVFQHDEAGVVSAATVYLWEVAYDVPADVCAKLEKVRAETVVFFWSPSWGSSSGAQRRSYFGIRFKAGSEAEKSPGELPEISLIFRDGQFADAWIKQRIDGRSWQWAHLKDGRPLGTESIVKP